MSRYGASLRSSGSVSPARCHSPLNCSASSRVEGERDRADVLDPERLRVADRAHGAGMDVREQHADDELLRRVPLRPRCVVTTGTSVTTTPGSESSRSLSRNDVRPAAERSDWRLNCSGTTTRDEVGLAARQAPHLLEQRLHPTLVGREDLELRLLLGEVPPAWPNARIGVLARREQRADRPSWRSCRAYQSAPSVATSIDSTQSSTLFVGSRAVRTALTPARSRRREAPVVAVDAEEQQRRAAGSRRSRATRPRRTSSRSTIERDHAGRTSRRQC